jgi:ribosome-associated protein
LSEAGEARARSGADAQAGADAEVGAEAQPRGRLLRIDERLSIPLGEIVLRASRSSGPGGQHANVTASRVEAIFDVNAARSLTDGQRELLLARAGERVTAVAQDERSQARNRELALERLAERLRRALTVPRSRRATRPSAAARASRLEQKRRAGQRKLQRRPPAADED